MVKVGECDRCMKYQGRKGVFFQQVLTFIFIVVEKFVRVGEEKNDVDIKHIIAAEMIQARCHGCH